MKTKFSFHAYSRVTDRISITHRELADLLDENLAINIGSEPGSNRVHRLFYSTGDNMCFVAVQDAKDNTVITILPIDYHQNISWVVSLEAQQQAKSLIEKKTTDSPSSNVITNSPDFKISGVVTDSYGKYIKYVNCGSWPSGPYDGSFERLIADKNFIDELIKNIRSKCNANDDQDRHISTIFIKQRKKESPVFFSVSDILNEAH